MLHSTMWETFPQMKVSHLTFIFLNGYSLRESIHQLTGRICLEIRNIKMRSTELLTSNHINERLANIVPVTANARRVSNSVIQHSQCTESIQLSNYALEMFNHEPEK